MVVENLILPGKAAGLDTCTLTRLYKDFEIVLLIVTMPLIEL